jgi:transcription elongation GreA/GreB family factor
MSRAFVREQDTENYETLPDRPVSKAPNDVTPEGLAQIEAHIQAEQQALAAAQAAGDRAAIAVAARELRYWTSRRASARVVAGPAEGGEIRFGSTVTICRDGADPQTFRIVGEDEADPKGGTISHSSPLARALFGKTEGDAAQLGTQEIAILGVT